MNKQGGAKYLSIWWFLVLIIIGIGIVAGVTLFYSRDVNVRQVEASILISKLYFCVVEHESEFLLDSFDIFEKCKLNEKVLSDNEHYFRVEMGEQKIDFGNQDIEVQWRFKQQGGKAKYFGECDEKSFLMSEAEIKILGCSNQEGKKGRQNV